MITMKAPMNKLIESERIVWCDIDGTLVIHGNWFTEMRLCYSDGSIEHVKDENIITVTDPYSGEIVNLRKNNPMIRLVKEEKSRGATIIAHSANGYRWVNTIIKALQLEKYVDIMLSKPIAYFDDKDVKDWVGQRVFIDHETIYKK